jgi:hypothetical protein
MIETSKHSKEKGYAGLSDAGKEAVRKVLSAIELVRLKHGACTFTELAVAMSQRKTNVNRWCTQMQEWGLVTWTHVHGSIQLTEQGRSVLGPRTRATPAHIPPAWQAAVKKPAKKAAARSPHSA